MLRISEVASRYRAFFADVTRTVRTLTMVRPSGTPMEQGFMRVLPEPNLDKTITPTFNYHGLPLVGSKPGK